MRSAAVRAVSLACLATMLAALPAFAEDGFGRWEAELPADYGLTTRDWSRVVAQQVRSALERGQPVSDRTLRLYGRPYPGLTWVEDEAGGHVALDPEANPTEVHVAPKGFAGTLTTALGPLLADPHYDPSTLGADRDELRRLAREIVKLQVQQPHKDWDFGGGIKDFGRGPGLYYFWTHYLTLRLLGDLLDEHQRQYYGLPLLEGVMGHQMAPRPTESVVVSGWGPAGNTRMEENMWGLDNRIPRALYLQSVGAEAWREAREALNRDLVNACSTWHLQQCADVVEGRPVNDWATGCSWWADFTIANHTSPDVMYAQNAINTACVGAAHFLDVEGSVPDVFMYNFDWVARRFLLPLTLWRGRIYSPNERERTRYGESAQYFQAIRLGTYLKLRHRSPLAARLERDCLAFGEWSGRIAPQRGYLANLLSGVEVQAGPEQDLQRWLSGNALFWAHAALGGIAVNRTPRRLAVMGAESGVSDWAVVPRDGDWLLSAWGRLGQDSFVRRRTRFFGGGFAGIGTKADGSRHALVALPDEQTVIVLSHAGDSEAPGTQISASLALLSSDLNGYTRRLHSAQGERALSRDADAEAGAPAPLAGPWLNVDDRIGYIVVHPGGARFSHGLHRNEAKGEFRIPVSWPGVDDARDCCTVIVADQAASATADLAADEAGCRWLDAGPEVSMARVPGRDGSDYIVAVNWSSEPRRVSAPMVQGSISVPVLGRSWRLDGGMLTGTLAPEAAGVAQVAAGDAVGML
ncbi:MAG: hypothetical protein ACP5KN_16690, partial [Armatimonadota bacterium]